MTNSQGIVKQQEEGINKQILGVKGLSHKNKENDQLLMKLLMVLQILLVRTLEMYREQYGEYA